MNIEQNKKNFLLAYNVTCIVQEVNAKHQGHHLQGSLNSLNSKREKVKDLKLNFIIVNKHCFKNLTAMMTEMQENLHLQKLYK